MFLLHTPELHFFENDIAAYVVRKMKVVREEIVQDEVKQLRIDIEIELVNADFLGVVTWV